MVEKPGPRVRPIPLAYLITFSCYGARLHGDESGSVDRSHNVYGTPLLASNPSRVSSEERRTKQTPYCLDGSRRAIVLAAVVELCAHREWRLLAAHIRTQHVHMVIAAEDAPEKVLEDAKNTPAGRSIAQARRMEPGDDGPGTAAHAIFGDQRTWGPRFTMWCESKGNRWRFGKTGMHSDKSSSNGAERPHGWSLLYSRGSEGEPL